MHATIACTQYSKWLETPLVVSLAAQIWSKMKKLNIAAIFYQKNSEGQIWNPEEKNRFGNLIISYS